jgi:hypothetical protein
LNCPQTPAQKLSNGFPGIQPFLLHGRTNSLEWEHIGSCQVCTDDGYIDHCSYEMESISSHFNDSLKARRAVSRLLNSESDWR